MRLVVQRVEKAKVIKVEDDSIAGEIGKGLLVLVGFKKGDREKEVEVLAAKLSKLRIMADAEEKMNLSVDKVDGKMLIVSQFTLHADTKDGNRPSFINAEDPQKAEKLYKFFVAKLKELGVEIETGSFGDYMKIKVVLDGPVTILYSD